MDQLASATCSRITGRTCYAVALGFALALGACAAPVESDEASAQAEALYAALDFKVGIRTIKYFPGNPKPTGGDEEWTWSFSDTALGTTTGTSFSPWTVGPTDPTGLRVALKSVGENNAFLQNADFRLALKGENETDTVRTKWASEGSSKSDYVHSHNPIRWKIGIETRVWPVAVRRNVTNFAIGVDACDNGGCGGTQMTPLSLLEMAPGSVPSWSHTAAGKTDGGIHAAALELKVTLN